MLKKNIEQDFQKNFDILEKIFTKTQCSFQSKTIPRVWMKLFDLNISNYTKTYLVISTAFLLLFSAFCFGGNNFLLVAPQATMYLRSCDQEANEKPRSQYKFSVAFSTWQFKLTNTLFKTYSNVTYGQLLVQYS